MGASKWMSPASASDPSRSPVHRSCQGAGRPGVAGVRAGDGKEPIGGCMRQATGGGGAAMAAKSGVVWAPGRSFWAADVRDVARGACRAGGLRLGPVGAARPRPASDLPPRADHRPPTRHFQPPPPRALLLFFSSQVLGCVWQLLGAGPSARGPAYRGCLRGSHLREARLPSLPAECTLASCLRPTCWRTNCERVAPWKSTSVSTPSRLCKISSALKPSSTREPIRSTNTRLCAFGCEACRGM